MLSALVLVRVILVHVDCKCRLTSCHRQIICRSFNGMLPVWFNLPQIFGRSGLNSLLRLSTPEQPNCPRICHYDTGMHHTCVLVCVLDTEGKLLYRTIWRGKSQVPLCPTDQLYFGLRRYLRLLGGQRPDFCAHN